MSAPIGCGCGHKLDFCHKVNASRYCGAETPNVTLIAALVACAEAAGEDTSGGVPSWPSVEAWAVAAVRQLRQDYDDDTASTLTTSDRLPVRAPETEETTRLVARVEELTRQLADARAALQVIAEPQDWKRGDPAPFEVARAALEVQP